MNMKKNIKNESLTIIIFFVLFIAICLVFQSLQPSFLSIVSITTMLKTGSAIAIAALGLTYVIIVNHSDISFYMTSCFSAMLMAWLIQLGLHPIFCIIAGLLSGVFWGTLTGLAVGKFKLPDIISTIAIGSIAFGSAYIFSDGAFIYDNFHTSGIIMLSEYRIFGITLSVYIMLLLYFLSYMILEKSKYGRFFYATGLNKKAAFFSGVNVNKAIIIAFIVSSVFAALSAIISSAAQGQGNVKIGLNLLMPCFSAIYIGWSIFRKPCVIGTLFGALLATVITTGFTVLSIPYYYSDLTMSLILLLSIGISKIEFSSTIKKQQGKRNG